MNREPDWGTQSNVWLSQTPAIFLSRTAALMGVIKAGRAKGVSDQVIQKHGRSYPVYKRGELVGYQAWYPVSNTADVRQPVMEN